jgi:uncharacterized protein YjbJ (UPF0337 family)
MTTEATGKGRAMSNESTTEKIKGSAKEVAGQVLGDEDMEKEGQAQQDKARQAEEAEAKKAEAAAAEKKAEGHKGEQKSRE